MGNEWREGGEISLDQFGKTPCVLGDQMAPLALGWYLPTLATLSQPPYPPFILSSN